MSSREDSDIDDDDFSELYKEYTGPPRSNTKTNLHETTKTSKWAHDDSDEEEEPFDPNAVPTDFTRRDAKFWDAKSKATEKNWKKKKEEEMICKLCGESTHYTQGCPSTLGANKKSEDLFTRVPARDPQVKALFTENIIKKIETNIGCKIKLEEKFIIVRGKDGQILSKGVDAVHNIKNESNSNIDRSNSSKVGNTSSYNIDRSNSPKVGNTSSYNMDRSNSSKVGNTSSYNIDRSNSPKVGNTSSYNIDRSKSPKGRNTSNYNIDQSKSPKGRNTSNYNQRSGRQDTVIEETKRLPQAYEKDGGPTRSTKSKSPASRPLYTSETGLSTFPNTFEELELEYKKNLMDISKIRDNQEDQENHRHREAVKDMRENYMKRLTKMRETHAKQWDKFFQIDTIRRQQVPNSGFNGYKHNDYIINNTPIDSRVSYHQELNNYQVFQHQKRENYGEPYNRY